MFSKSISLSLNNVLIALKMLRSSPVSVITLFTTVSFQAIESDTTNIPPFSLLCNLICSMIVSQIISLPNRVPISSFSPLGLLFKLTTFVINVLIFEVILSMSTLPSSSTKIILTDVMISMISSCHSLVVKALTFSEIVIVPSPISMIILAIVSVMISLATKSSYFSSLISTRICTCLFVSFPVNTSNTELPSSSTNKTLPVVIIFLISSLQTLVIVSSHVSLRNLLLTTKNESS